MKRVLTIIYTLATVLIIVGALFIIQNESYGLTMLALGLGLNCTYRILNLNYDDLKKCKTSSVIKMVGITVMIAACILIFTDFEQKFNLLILSVILDVAINYKEISLKNK